MVTEGELRNNSLDDSDKVKELQDKVADLKAEVSNKTVSKFKFKCNPLHIMMGFFMLLNV